jgi:capsular polysaccharide transport system permease protein
MTHQEKIRWIWRVAAGFVVVSTLYWGVLAAKRYVSESHIVVESLQAPAPTFDLSSVLGGSAQSKDILLLRDYLLSVDMLRALEEKLKLRAHYSDSYDVLSRMIRENVSWEWFHSHYLGRVEAQYDEYTGLLTVKAQAYTPEMAHAIGRALVEEGERFMNELAHRLAREQVAFAEREVAATAKRYGTARQTLLAFQNKNGLVSPTATLESLSAVAARLEGELSALQARRRALESYLTSSAPEMVQINSQVRAVEQQLAAERARLASPNGSGSASRALNRVAEEYDRLVLDATFQQDVYRTALVALERARVDASRMLKKVSVIQSPTKPEYSLEPARLYTITIFLIAAIVIAGILHVMLDIIREHRD